MSFEFCKSVGITVSREIASAIMKFQAKKKNIIKNFLKYKIRNKFEKKVKINNFLKN